MEMKEAMDAIGGLSNPSKMPCESYSLPATRCKLGSVLAQKPGTTCHGCYALKGFYRMRATREAMDRRMAVIDRLEDDAIAAAEWTAAFAIVLNDRLSKTVKAIKRNGQPGKNDGRYFRWHDSGDIQSANHLLAIFAVCEATPGVQHWLPTREAGTVHSVVSRGYPVPPNLTIRISVPRVDAEPAGYVRSLAEHPRIAWSGVHTTAEPIKGAEECDAPTRANACGPCRACWDPARKGITYRLH